MIASFLRGRRFRWVLGSCVAVVLGYLFLYFTGWLPVGGTAAQGLSYTVHLRSIADTVVERGTLESQKTVVGTCQLPGYQNKVISIVPEGTQVAEGDVVVTFDSAEVDRMINEKSATLNEAQGKLEQATADLAIQLNKNQSDIETAKLELELAKLDRDKYLQGDYIAEKTELERGIAEGAAELEKVEDELRNMEILVNRGFRTPEQLREVQLRRNSFNYRLERDKQKMSVLVDFEFIRKRTEFEGKARELELKLQRTEDTAVVEQRKAEAAIVNAQNAVSMIEQEMAELKQMKEFCQIKAPQSGTVAYANQPWFDDEYRIREGATVRRQQAVFYLPDMQRMQVKIQIHESVVNKIAPKQKAAIRLDAFPDTVLEGTVHYVSELAQSGFMSNNSYETIVHIDSFPDSLSLKPGMTAQVEIKIGVYQNILAVPVAAVTEHQGQAYVYRIEGLAAVRHPVKTGRYTHSFVELLEGALPGQRLAMDAYQRSLNDFRQQDEQEPEGPAPVGQPPQMVADAP